MSLTSVAGRRALRRAGPIGGRVAGALVTFAATLAGLLLVTFVIARVVPIDPVIQVVGDRASPETYAQAREAMGLDRPILVQFVRYAASVLSGDLGQSLSTGRAVIDDIATYFPATLELATLATLIGVVAGVPLGVWAAYRSNTLVDHVIRLVALLGYSVPVFWLGLMALLVFYAKLGWTAGPGRIDIAYQYTLESWSGLMLLDTLRAGDIDAFRSALAHLVLPVLLLAYFSLAYIARMTRSFMIEELGKEYVTTARVKGASEARVLWRHALPNVAVPLVTVVVLSYAVLLEGAVLTETVFAWPGLGLYITNALFAADMAAVMGATLVIGACFVLLNGLSELLYLVLDPRAR